MGNYKPLLYFMVGLIATSVALIAATFSVLDKIFVFNPYNKPVILSDFGPSLLSFLMWMAITIIFATVCAGVLQIRICMQLKGIQAAGGANKPATTLLDYIIAGLPIVPGLFATAHIVNLAWHQGASLF